MKKLTVATFEAYFRTRQEAAKALGVTRQSLWNWEEWYDGAIPEPWNYKAAAVLKELEDAAA